MSTIIHGHTVGGKITPEYRCWANMKNRCNNEKVDSYQYYGGRGITVCSRWLNSFSNFYVDMGDRPDGTSIERVDRNGNYEPDNCIWANAVTQNTNRCQPNSLEVRGECKNGHKYTGDSFYVIRRKRRGLVRACKQCQSDNHRRYRIRKALVNL